MVNFEYSPALLFDGILNIHLWHDGIKIRCDNVKNIDSTRVNAVLKCTLLQNCLKLVQFASPL